MATAPASLDLSTASDSGASNSDDLTNNTMPVITGTGVDGEVITLTSDQDGLLQGSATVSGGVWTFYVTTPLSENTHAITATATDGSNGTADSAAPLTFEIDTTANAAPAVTSVSDDNGSSSSDGVTNDDTLSISGTAVANSEVEVFIDGVSIGNATANGAGAWTFDHTGTTLAEGTYVVTATSTDDAGNVSAPSADYTVVVDTSAPAAPAVTAVSDDTGSSTTDGITSDATLTITGTAEANSTVDVLIDGVSIGTVAADANGDWSFDHTGTTLADATYAITATATDAAGNTSPASTGFALVVDTAAPAAPAVVSISDDTGTSPTDEITSDTSLTFTGTAAANSTVEVFIDGASIGTVAADGGGNWTFDHTGTALADGVYSVTATATDAAGNTSAASASMPLEVDTTANAAPVVTGISADTGAADNSTANGQQIFSGTAVANSEVEVFIDGVSIGNATANGAGAWTLDHTGTTLAEGTYVVTATSTDVAGNVSAPSADFTVVVDSTAPAAPVVTAVSDDTGSSTTDGVTSDNTLTITGTAEANSTVAVLLDGVSIGTVAADANGDWSFDHTGATLADATYAITATATDGAGNTSAASSAFTLEVDTVAPAAPTVDSISDDTGASPTDEITSDTSLTFTGTAVANSTVEVFIDGVSIGTTAADGLGDWTFDHTGTALAEGTYSVTATASDTAGNTSAASAAMPLEVDTTANAAPAVTGISDDTGATDGITSDGTLNITGTAVANSSVEVFIDGASIGTTTADGSGNWTYDHTATTLADATYAVTATSTDVAGNVSAASSAFTLVVDSSGPNAPVVSGISADTGSSSSDNVTMTAMQTISGTAEAGSSVLVTIDGTPAAAPVVADAMGNWTYDHTFPSNSIATGATHVITATATDTAGNTSAASSAFVFVLDTTAPSASPIALDAASVSPGGVITVTDEAAPTFSFTAESNSILEIDYGDGNGFVSAGTGTGALQTVTKPAAYATEGSKTVTLRATDLAGNVTTVAALAITVNLVATDLELSNNLIVDSATDGTVVGSVEVTDGTPGDTHTYVLTNNDGGNFVLNGTTLEVDGTPTFTAGADRTIEIQVTDGAGNVYTETMTVEVEAQPTVGNNGGNAAGEAVTGTFVADNIDAGAGDDTVSTGFGDDTVTTGDGADVIRDSATNLNGDTFTDFDDEDEIVFTGAQFDADDLTFTAGAGGAPSTLAIDSDGDGTADTTITLNEALTGGNFLVFQQGSETKVSYEQSLIALGEGTSIAADAENGIVSQSFLTGDGTNTYNVSLDSARSGASAKNLLGVYEVDATGEIVDVRLVFADTSVSTDPSFTITGVDAGNKLGFFLVFDGADLVTNAATDVFDFVPANGAAGDANISAGTALDLTINGTVVNNNIFHSFDTTLNSDGVQHAVSGVQADGNGIDIGFEDLFGGGDRDYQDVVISVDIV